VKMFPDEFPDPGPEREVKGLEFEDLRDEKK
jgi:hypothetical protein